MGWVILISVLSCWAVCIPGIIAARKAASVHRVPDWRFLPLGLVVWDYSPCPRRVTVCKSCGEKYKGYNAYDESVLYTWLLLLVTALGIGVWGYA